MSNATTKQLAVAAAALLGSLLLIKYLTAEPTEKPAEKSLEKEVKKEVYEKLVCSLCKQKFTSGNKKYKHV